MDQRKFEKGNLKDLKAIARTKLAEQDFKVDYVEIADAVTLELADEWNGEQKLVALAAAFLNEVRLIDNFVMQSWEEGQSERRKVRKNCLEVTNI